MPSMEPMSHIAQAKAARASGTRRRVTVKPSSRLHFERLTEQAGFLSPLAGMQHVEQTIEVRRDPLMGTTAVTSSQLRLKEEMFFGTTDWRHAEEIAAFRSSWARSSCSTPPNDSPLP